jgi:hypothetical protein
MNPYLASYGLRLNDCWFSEPTSLAGWIPPRSAGLFALFVHDPHWAPKPFQPLCFGEFGNNASAAVLPNHYRALLAAANGKPILVSACPLPFSTTRQRLAMRDELVWAYNPVCQTERKHVDRKHEEYLAPSVEPVADTQKEPRRRMGFMPQCEPALVAFLATEAGNLPRHGHSIPVRPLPAVLPRQS